MSGRLESNYWRREPVGRNGRKSDRKWWVRSTRIAGACLLVAVSVAILGGLGWRVKDWVCRSPVFALRQVEITGHVTLDPDVLRALSGLEMGCNLFELDVREVGTRIEQHPRIRRAVVTRRPPDRLSVRVIERVPVAQILSDAWYEIDGSGVVLGRVRHEFRHSLPRFLGVGDRDGAVPGTAVEDPVMPRLLALLAALRRPPMGDLGFDRRLSLFLVSEDGSLMIPADSGSATLRVGREDWIRRIEKLAIVEPCREDTRSEPEMIDLRFENQVVVGPMPRWGKELAQVSWGA